MVLTKDGQTISLDNSDHINAFLGSGWAEAKASAPAPKAEKVEEPKAEEVKVAEKKAVGKKKQEK
jgi:hypothetical protein